MQQLGTDRAFVQEQYSDAERLRIRIETHKRYSQGETERILDDGVDALCLSPGLRILDVGCGAGSWHARIAATGAALVGIDLMPGMLQEAHADGAVLEPTPAFAQADAQALPFGAATVDRVLCAGVLYHVPDCEQALREMCRVLRPGGRAVISTNGAYAMRRIYELHGDAARELGYEPLPITPGHFTMEDLPLASATGLSFRNAPRSPWCSWCLRRRSQRCAFTQPTASMPYAIGRPTRATAHGCSRLCASES